MNPYKCLSSYQENYNVALSMKNWKGLKIDVTGSDCDLGLELFTFCLPRREGRGHSLTWKLGT